MYTYIVHTYHACIQVKELLLPYGTLRAFNLVMDRQTGNSKVCDDWVSMDEMCVCVCVYVSTVEMCVCVCVYACCSLY